MTEATIEQAVSTTERALTTTGRALTTTETTADAAATMTLTEPAEAAWEQITAAAPPAEAAAQAGPARTRSDVFQLTAAATERAVTAQRATRGTIRRTAGVRPAVPPRATTTPAARTTTALAARATTALTARTTAMPAAPATASLAALATATLAARTIRAAERSAARESAAIRRAAAARRTAAVAARPQTAGQGAIRQIRRVRTAVPHRRTVVTKHATVRHTQRVMPLGNGMTAVIAFARSQVGKRYVSGGEGPFGFDCSGFTKRAYARVGIRLPHSSGGQAARARTISRAQARPGDLVVGRGHVGIYMGRGMMIDAGNQRTGVVYRKLYSGLRVARL